MRKHVLCGCVCVCACGGDIDKVYIQRFWMKHWGHPNPKRSVVWASTPLIRMLSLGSLIGEQRKSTLKCAEAYVDSRGKRCYKGLKTLKKTGPLGSPTLYKCLH